MEDLVADAGTPDVLLDEPGMTFVVLYHEDGHGLGEGDHAGYPSGARGRSTVKVLPRPTLESREMLPPS